MNIISIIYIICSFIAFESAVTTYRLNRRAVENNLFMAFSMNFALFSLTFSQLVASPGMESAQAWHMVTTPTGMISAMLTLHFSLALTGYKREASNPLIFLPMYIPSLYFMYRVFNGSIITGVGNTPWGWDVMYDLHSLESFLGIFHSVLCLTMSALLIFRWYYRTGNILEKKQAMSVLPPFILGITGSIFVMLHIIPVNPLYTTLVADIAFVLFFTFFIIGVRFAIGKYRLMNLHPGIAVIDLLMGIKQPCFLIDRDGVILCRNSETDKITGSGRADSIYGIFSSHEIIREEMRLLSEKSTGTTAVRCFINSTASGTGHRSFNLNIQCIIDEGGSHSGFLIMASDDPQLSDFMKNYDITVRQMEIIQLALSGMSNAAISGMLGISERTVENHLFNIYNKIGIDNRIELMKKAAEYKLLPA